MNIEKGLFNNGDITVVVFLAALSFILQHILRNSQPWVVTTHSFSNVIPITPLYLILPQTSG